MELKTSAPQPAWFKPVSIERTASFARARAAALSWWTRTTKPLRPGNATGDSNTILRTRFNRAACASRKVRTPVSFEFLVAPEGKEITRLERSLLSGPRAIKFVIAIHGDGALESARGQIAGTRIIDYMTSS